MRSRHIITVCLVLLLFFPFVALAQSSLYYQYWIDDNKDEAVSGTTTDSGDGGGINLELDVSSLSPGVHYYNIRTAEDGEWGTTSRYIFSIPAVAADVAPSYMESYEYWFDDDYDNRVSVSVPDDNFEEHTTGVVPIDVSDLAPGVHYYNMRILGSDEKWSTTQRYIFSIPAESAGTTPADLKNIEYWIDDDYDNRESATISGDEYTTSEGLASIDMSAYAPGVHYYNMRAQDEDGIWSAPQRFIFSIPAESAGTTPADLKNIEYWIDDDYDNRESATISGDEYTTSEGLASIDMSAYAPGVHYYNMRVQDEDGIWSAPQRYIFSIPAVASGTTPSDLKIFEYWIDDDYESRVRKAITDDEYTTDGAFASIDMTDYVPGIHYYNMRVQDEDGIWSAPQRYIFSIPAPQQATVDKQLTGYLYAFNDDALKEVAFPSAVDEFDQSISFNVPSPGTLMVVDDSCKFEFNSTDNTLKMRRYTPMSFALFFKDQSNTLSAPLVEEFVVADSLTQDVTAITSPGTYPIATHESGGFSALRFDVASSVKLALRANGNCGLRLYDSEGELLNAYDSLAIKAGAAETYAAGTYYAIVFENTEAIKVALYPGDEEGMRALRPSIAYDEDTQIVTISGTVDGASYYYTINGDNPTLESTSYTEPFEVSQNVTIKAIAAWGDMVVTDNRSYVVSSIKGDASGDGVIDIQDVVAIVNFILGIHNDNFAENLADMNDDGEVDIFDAMLLVNYVLAHPTTSGSRMMTRGETVEPAEAITLAAEQDGISIGIDQAERFTAFQFDLTLPNGVELSDVKLASESSAHRLMFANVGRNTYRVIGFSMSNALFPQADGKFLELHIANAANGEVGVDNVLFVTPELQSVYFTGGRLGTTAIENIELNSEAKDIYNLRGEKQGNSLNQLDKGVYIINKKKVIIK